MPEQLVTKQKGKGNPLVYSEVGVAGTDILYKYGLSNTENPDTTISRKGMKYIDEKVERDTHFTQCLATRRHKLIKKGWRIKPASPTRRDVEIADFVNHIIEAMSGSFEKDIEGMLDKVSKGFSLTEKNWMPIKYGKYQGKVGLKSLRYKPAKYFSFKYDKLGYWDIIQVDTQDYKPITLPKDKFIHVINGANDENPYGDSYGAKCAFWVWLKENEAKFWAIFSERFGMPITKVTMPRKVDSADKNKVNDILDAVQKDTGIQVPDGFVVDFLEATRSGDAAYDPFIERCNKEVSKIILGQTLSSEEGKRGQGSYALGQTHAQTMEDYIAFDAVDIAVAVNEQLIRPLVDYNYITNRYPVFEFLGVDISALISISQSVQNLVNSGLKIPESWVYQSSGIPVPKEDEAVLQSSLFITPNLPGDGETDEDGKKILESLNLNGIQIASASKIIESVSSGDVPRDSGLNQLMVFLGLSKEQAEAVMGDAGTGKIVKADKVINKQLQQNIKTNDKGIDNKIKMNTSETSELFREENPEFEQLLEKYKNDSVSLWNGFKNWFTKESKKKL